MLSQNLWGQGPYTLDFFDWTSYEVTPGDWRYVSFQDSVIGQVIPGIGYFPSIVAGIIALGSFLTFISVRAAKIICIIGGVIMVIGLFLYLMPTLILGMVGSNIPVPNELGAYFYIIPGFLAMIVAFFLKKTPEAGYVQADKEYYAIGEEKASPTLPAAEGPKIQCPHCGALVSADQLFCEQCGEYF